MTGWTDEYGFCIVCGGHGTVRVSRPATEEHLAGLRPRARARAVTAGVIWSMVECSRCDGRDLVTPFMEAKAP